MRIRLTVRHLSYQAGQVCEMPDSQALDLVRSGRASIFVSEPTRPAAWPANDKMLRMTRKKKRRRRHVVGK